MLYKSLQGAGGYSKKIQYNYQTTVGSTSNSASYTFSSQPIGTAASNRYVVLVILTAQGTGGLTTINSASIAGISTTLSVNERDGTSTASCNAAIAAALVTSGTTATIVVTTGASVRNCFVSIYSVYGLSSTTADFTSSSIADPISFSNCSFYNGGFIIGGVIQRGTNSTASWASPLIEEYDQIDSEGEHRTNAAFNPGYTKTSTVECTLSNFGTSGTVGVLASWKPA